MDRKEMLLKASLPERNELVDAGKLSELVDEAAALAAMAEMRGWKILLEKYIEPRISLDRIYNARGPFKRAEAIGAVRELDLLKKTVNGTIKAGEKANEKLESLKKP